MNLSISVILTIAPIDDATTCFLLLLLSLHVRAPHLLLALWFVYAACAHLSSFYDTLSVKSIIGILTMIWAYLCI